MIKYNKELIGPHNHPIIAPPTPNRQSTTIIDKSIKISNEKMYTQTEMEELINKVSEELSMELELKHKQDASEWAVKLDGERGRVLSLEEEVSRLNAKIDTKDLMLVDLTKQVNEILNRGGHYVAKNELTNLSIEVDTIFIDPSVRGAEDKMQNHIIVEEVKGEGSNVKDSVNKLKNLLGKKDKL